MCETLQQEMAGFGLDTWPMYSLLSLLFILSLENPITVPERKIFDVEAWMPALQSFWRFQSSLTASDEVCSASSTFGAVSVRREWANVGKAGSAA